MTKTKSEVLGRLAAVALLLLSTGFFLLGCGRGIADSSPSPADSSPSPNGRPTTVRTLQEKVVYPTVDVTLDPPSDKGPPIMSAEEALKHADSVKGSERGSSITETYAQWKGIPVWEVRYHGVCVPAYGPDQGPREDPCISDFLAILIDARSGEYLEAYSY